MGNSSAVVWKRYELGDAPAWELERIVNKSKLEELPEEQLLT